MTGKLIACFGAILLTAAGLGAQATFRTGIDVVEVDAQVTRGNKPMTGLTARNFNVTDNGVRQEITAVTQGELPLRVTLALDTSASVSGKRMTALIKAGNALVDALKPTDQMSLITFSHQVVLRVPMGSSIATFRNALASLTGSGATSLRDAVHLAVLRPPEEHTRALLLVFSDGRDTTSWLPETLVIESARRANIVIDSVYLDESPFLGRLAESTDGRSWAGRADNLQELFTRALEEMRARYVITYAPARQPASGWHNIKVSLKDIRADVTARPGYFVP